MGLITKLLIANRGEIACRVIRTARRLGIKTVAVFSEADRLAQHVEDADEALCIGPAAARDSYLRAERILEAAKQTGAQAVHPGYGFLSENAAFAEEAIANGITFIGPESKAIHMMGSKLAAKEAVKAYDIPMVPGIDEAITDVEKAKKISKKWKMP